MDYNSERLVESLIKMVGKLNHKVDSLEKRINQLEGIMTETTEKNLIHV